MSTEPTYGPAEVCAAAGVPRATFHSWLARRYFPLLPSPGAGRERRFSLTAAIRIAIVAELSRLGVSIGVAADASAMFRAPFRDGEKRVALLLWPASPPENNTAIAAPVRAVMTFATLDDVAYQLAKRRLSAFTMLDVTAIADRVADALGGSTTEPALPDWLERYLIEPGASSEISPTDPALDDNAVKPRPKSRKAAPPKA